ncbi:Leucine-rich repeat protein kinase family protein isoform 4 [Hibiscus syriacus]|uniref:non-specific serine/threonine protein kinase n=1 Tax=Hibiscus syriacus TaxID=106335 RepID=A0A6A2ZSM2_HIBSY|nr:Leucine-rich repeat protein kinase family protein isoform 4 [Hibiscus syriacus]
MVQVGLNHPESYCRNEVLKNRSNPNARGIGVSVGLIVGIAVITVLLAIAIIIICRHYCHRGISEQHLLHKSVQEKSTTGFSSEILTNASYISDNAKLGAQGLPPCRSFTLEELKEAANNFDNSAFLGEGSYGELFKGSLESGIQVAIRCLPTTKKYWIKNLKLRLDMLAKIRHPHLVSILGHCIEVEQDDCSVNRVFLVFEYIPNGNFRSHLSENCVGGVLNWSERLAVLIGVCKAVHIGWPNWVTKGSPLSPRKPMILRQMTRLEDDVYSFGIILLEAMLGSSIAAKMEATLRNELVHVNSSSNHFGIFSFDFDTRIQIIFKFESCKFGSSTFTVKSSLVGFKIETFKFRSESTSSCMETYYNDLGLPGIFKQSRWANKVDEPSCFSYRITRIVINCGFHSK